MGKNKQAQRTKNNVVPASSGRSAELLQSTSGVTIVGYNSLKEGGFIPLLTGVSDELDINISEDFRLVWKKMNKKDTITKLKALDEFKRLCQECDTEVLKPVLPFWPRLFCTLSTNEEHRVREATYTAHRALVTKAGRNIAPYLKQLIGPWFTGQHDTYPPAASAAENAFQETFPSNKLIEATIFCQEEILNYICTNLLEHTPQTLANNQNCSQEAKAARYQRVVVSCLNGYALYLQRLPIEHLHKAEEVNRKLVTSAKFWKLSKDPSPILRAAWFTALVALCEKAAFLLIDESKHVCTAVFSNLDETEPTAVHTVWQAVLLTFNIVQHPWQHVSLEKMILPKLWKVLREGADGNASLVFPNLLVLLSKVPIDEVNDKGVFYSKFFESLRAGLQVRSVQISGKETAAVITAFLECLRYLVSINVDDKPLCQAWLDTQLLPLLEAVMSDTKLLLGRTCLFSGLANIINAWSKPSTGPSSYLVPSFWSQLSPLCTILLENSVTDITAFDNICAAIQALLCALTKPDSRPRSSLKVKFVSPRKYRDEEDGSGDEEVNESPAAETAKVYPLFEHHYNLFVEAQLDICFHMLENCGDRAKVVLVGHLARVVAECASPRVYSHVTQQDWSSLYIQRLGRWLRDDRVPLDYSLTLIFTLLQYVEDDNHVQAVYADLSGEKWQAVLEWALQQQTQQATVKQFIVNHGSLCRMIRLLTCDHPCYNMLHTCLRNLRHSAWLTTETLTQVITSLQQNLTDSSISTEVKLCSANLLNATLQNNANDSVLSQLATADLTSLLTALFTASLRGLQDFPNSWQHCLRVLALNTSADLTFSASCESCVDLLVATVRTKVMDLTESQALVDVLEELISVAVTAESQAALTTVVLSRLSACLMDSAERVWQLYSIAEYVTLKDIVTLGSGRFQSHTTKDPLASVPLQQYVTAMVPFLMMVVRLQTASETPSFPYGSVRAALEHSDLCQWTLQVLHLQSVCRAFCQHFATTRQYFLLKEKIAFVLEECGLLSQVKLKTLIEHLNLSLLEDGSSSLLHCNPLVKLQTKAVLQDLSLLYDVKQVQRELLPYKDKVTFIKQNFYPEEALEEIAARETIDNNQLSAVNCCCRRLTELHSDSIPINVLDRVFDLLVAEHKENRSLLRLPEEELLNIAAVAEFTCHSVTHLCAHMTQSSWDACLVATAALSLSVNTTLAQWKAQEEHTVDKSKFLRFSVVRVLYAVCRLFSAVSEHMSHIDSEDKAGLTRRTEWTEVFVPNTHTAITEAWRSLAELPCEEPATVLLLEALSFSVSHHVIYPHFTDGNTLSCLDNCCQLLQSPDTSVQVTAYKLLLRLVPAMVELDLEQSEKDNVALSCQHVDKALLYTQSIVEIILSGLKFGDMCIVEPFTDSYSYTRCYLLLWSALLELCDQACSQLRALYTTWLKEAYLSVFMKTMFCLMPEAALHGDVPSQRITQFFSQPNNFDKVVWNSERLAQMSCRVFAESIRRLPAAIRQWWTEAEHRVSTLVETLTATYVSPELCLEEMRAIQSHNKKFDNMTVHVSSAAKEVYAVYTVEESRMELVIELAHNHPLGLVKVRSGQRMVSTAQTRQWLLQITIFLTHQNGSIWDALELWKNSLDKRFEGVEECYICFAILHSASLQLPKLSCQTCRKKFHTHCLYKWFTTSNKSTCPICRNLF